MKIAFVYIFVIGISISSFGQKQLRVIDWKAETTVNAFLLSKMHEQYDARRNSLARALQSPALISAYRDSCRIKYKRLLRQLPSRSPLKVQVTGKLPQKGYHIEKIIYESIPDHHVTANLYVPEGKGKFPAVLLFCGHEDDAKATESYQRTAILFALNGFVVLVIDPISQSERHELTDDNHKPRTRGGTTEHTLVNAAANLVGSGTVAYQLWDNIRGLDYLEGRNEVDKSRIGCLGNSGGGTQTTYFVAYDDRVKVAAPCSFVASRERNFEWFGPSDGCQHIPYEGEAQLEISDFLIAFAPKPLLVLAGKYDFVDYYGTTQAFKDVAAVYRGLGAGERAKLFSVEDGHGISLPKREAAVSWFKKWLAGDSIIRQEQKINLVDKELLRSTGMSQVNARFPNEQNDFSRTLNQAKLFDDSRSVGDLKKKIGKVLRIDFPRIPVSGETRGMVDYNGFTFEKILIKKMGQIPLPALILLPKIPTKEVVVWLHGRGKQTIADSTALLYALLNGGNAVVVADISGTGELADPEIVNDPKYFNAEYRNAMLGLHVGYPMPSLRTRDIVTIIDFVSVRPDLQNKPLTMYAHGVCTLPALHAAVLDPRIGKLHSIGGISSFKSVIENPLQRNWYSYVLPGVLQYYDVSDLVAALKGRVVIAD